MTVTSCRSQDYELVDRSSSDLDNPFDDSTDLHTRPPPVRSWLPWPFHGYSKLPTDGKVSRSYPRARRRKTIRWIWWSTWGAFYLLLFLVLFNFIVIPSYTRRPAHYKELRRRCRASDALGRANLNNEKVLITASIYDKEGSLTGGHWGKAVLELVDLLGPENVHLSIYENDPDELAKTALEILGSKVTSNASLVAEHLPFDDIARVVAPSGEKRIKRIAFLAEVRNRALRPLDGPNAPQFDKILVINDVVFDPIEAAQLLFSTNYNAETGRAEYGAACAVDFINAFKFYDTFATRDLEGNSIGIPFYPWFTSAGRGESRRDVLAQKDAVRVRSCWGGMTAFEAKWFQQQNPSSPSDLSTFDSYEDERPSDIPPFPHKETARPTTEQSLAPTPLRFRFENDTFWDASECCLIHADLQYLRSGLNVTSDTGIYLNPYIRVAYDSSSLSWLSFTRRFERLYAPVHRVLNWVIGMPWGNPRILEQPGDEVEEQVWQYDDDAETSGGHLTGSLKSIKRIAGPGKFCGGRKLLVLNENPKEGEARWENLPLPHS